MINIINDNELDKKLNLQDQHYNMAAIIARGWKYKELTKKKGRKYSVCLFDTNKFFELTKEEKKLNKGKTYFELIQDKSFRDKKILENITNSPEEEGENRTIQSIFTSLLLTPEIEKILNIEKIEEKFLSLLEKSDDLINKDIIELEENIEIIKDYLALQNIRSPVFYRFLLNEYFFYKINLYIQNKKENGYRNGYPALFKEISLLDTPRIKEFIKYAENWYKKQYKEVRKNLEDCNLLVYRGMEINLHLGDISSFYFNFKQYGIKEEEINKIIDYSNNKEFLNTVFFSPITAHSFICAFPKRIEEVEIIEKFNKIILPTIKSGFTNQIIFLYSKYIICPPIYRKVMEQDLIKYLTLNNIEYLYKAREEEISYILNLEKILKHAHKYESLFNIIKD